MDCSTWRRWYYLNGSWWASFFGCLNIDLDFPSSLFLSFSFSLFLFPSLFLSFFLSLCLCLSVHPEQHFSLGPPKIVFVAMVTYGAAHPTSNFPFHLFSFTFLFAAIYMSDPFQLFTAIPGVHISDRLDHGQTRKHHLHHE